MKTRLLATFFCTLLTSFVQAQNYNPVISNNDALFLATDGLLHAMHIDSITTASGEVSFHLLKTIPYNNQSSCYGDDYAADWTGAKLLKKGNDFYFFNKNNDSIKLSPTEELNASWRFYTYQDNSYVEATIIAKEKENFLTLSDSVKTISLQVKDVSGTNITDPLNGKTLKISKNYGIVSIPVFLEFPSSFEMYELAGLSNPQIGLQLLTPRKIYNFNIGDEFHYKEASGNLPDIYNISRVIKVIGKYTSANTDTIRYNLSDYSETETQHYDFSNPQTPTYFSTYSSATTNYIRPYIVSDSIIYPVIHRLSKNQISNDLQAISLRLDASQNGRLTQVIDSFPVNDGSNCWTRPTDAGIYSELLEGAAYLYHDRGSFIPNNERLVYYKKGSETWGEPLTLSTYTPSKNTNLSLYPNPLKQGEQLHIQTSNFKVQRLAVYNTTGNKVLESASTADAIESLDVSQLQPGLYIIQLVNSNNEFTSSKFIIK